MTGALAACSDDPTPVAPVPEGTYVRVINSLYQEVPGDVPVARPIDHLFDSATTLPSVLNLAANTISVSSDAPTGYRLIASGVRNFVARIAGGTPLHGTVYSTQGDGPYLPRLHMDAGGYYSVVVAGVVPADGPVPYGAVPMILFGHDPFPGPVVNGVTQARFNVLNVAPFNAGAGSGRDIDIIVVPGTSHPGDPIETYRRQSGAGYRGGSQYINVNPGSYSVTVVGDGMILAQQIIAFSEGDVKTLVLQNTSAVGSGTANHKLTVLHDQHWE